MKTQNKQQLVVLFLFIFSVNVLYSQSRVGINTTSPPRKTLEVNGSTKIGGQLMIGTLNSITSSDTYDFIMQENTSGAKFIKKLGTPSAVNINALGYFLEYQIKTGNDWVQSFNTGINKNKFWVTVVEANFSKRVRYDVSGSGGNGWTTPFVTASITGNDWFIYADYPLFNTNGANPDGTWYIKLLITPKKLLRNLGTQTIDMSGNSTGAAATPIIN